MNTFAFVGDLEGSPEVSCVYHSEEAENQVSLLLVSFCCCFVALECVLCLVSCFHGVLLSGREEGQRFSAVAACPSALPWLAALTHWPAADCLTALLLACLPALSS